MAISEFPGIFGSQVSFVPPHSRALLVRLRVVLSEKPWVSTVLIPKILAKLAPLVFFFFLLPPLLLLLFPLPLTLHSAPRTVGASFFPPCLYIPLCTTKPED